MRCRPNFFIVGAPKSGTTALYTYLSEHPNIFMAPVKEPHFFAPDLENPTHIYNEDEYFKLFCGCNNSHLAIGEASTFYMFSEIALKQIRNYDPDSKIIAMLRNPVDLAYSFYFQTKYNGNEDVNNFEVAWNLQDLRARGQNIPKNCRQSYLLQYKKIASLGFQIERLLNIFPREQVKIIFFEDLINNTQVEYESVLKFLGVPVYRKDYFKKINESKVHRFEIIGHFFMRLPKPLLISARFIRNALNLPDDSFRKILDALIKKNARPFRRPSLRPEFRCQLVREFKGDIKKLSSQLGRDLDSWLH